MGGEFEVPPTLMDQPQEPLHMTPSLTRGVEVIRETMLTLPQSPGVYRMLGEADRVLYVGKAKSLKKRVVSYTQTDKLPNRLKRMVAQTMRMEIVVTRTETEALLLECNLIKQLRPTYNILLKDDKAFPYIFMTDHPFPKFIKYRGKRDEKGVYFGPFASAAAVDDMLLNLQKVFYVRNCGDEVFKNRKRPCLQYFIKRCSAPCVGYTKRAGYHESVKHARDFLKGKNADVQHYLSSKMQDASNDQRYEEAAQYRDRLKLLQHIQTHQRINVPDIVNADIMAIAEHGGKVCVQVFFYRYGSNYGTESFFLEHSSEEITENLSAFLKQFYGYREPPELVLLNMVPDDFEAIKDAFTHQYSKKIEWTIPKMGPKADLVRDALMNAQKAIQRNLLQKTHFKDLFQDIAVTFSLNEVPKRIEIYDNSHLFGRHAYGVMVVATPEGLEKKSYRKFLIQNPGQKGVGGDDYAMMREVMMRRFSHKEEGWTFPDLLLIDGGLGQVNAVKEILIAQNLIIPVVGIAKGAERHAGRETFIVEGVEPFQLPPQSKTLHLLQRLRDEAHRFGITSHRKKREKSLKQSMLDAIPGIGPKRKKALLLHFGSPQHVARAALEDLLNVEGIDKSVAKKIHAYFHEAS